MCPPSGLTLGRNPAGILDNRKPVMAVPLELTDIVAVVNIMPHYHRKTHTLPCRHVTMPTVCLCCNHNEAPKLGLATLLMKLTHKVWEKQRQFGAACRHSIQVWSFTCEEFSSNYKPFHSLQNSDFAQWTLLQNKKRIQHLLETLVILYDPSTKGTIEVTLSFLYGSLWLCSRILQSNTTPIPHLT